MNKLDMDYRPASYWAEDDPIQVLLSGIKGEARRQIVQQRLESGATGDLPEGFLDSQLDEATRRAWGAIHPLMMGGEYLPDDLPGETTIARVALNSMTGDVIEVRARPIGEGIGYRVVDEYETDFVLPFDSSPLPLTTGEMIKLLDETIDMFGPEHPGLIMYHVTRNYGGGPGQHEPIDRWRRKVQAFARLSAASYPRLSDWYDARIDAWMDTLLVSYGCSGVRWGSVMDLADTNRTSLAERRMTA